MKLTYEFYTKRNCLKTAIFSSAFFLVKSCILICIKLCLSRKVKYVSIECMVFAFRYLPEIYCLNIFSFNFLTNVCTDFKMLRSPFVSFNLRFLSVKFSQCKN